MKAYNEDVINIKPYSTIIYGVLERINNKLNDLSIYFLK